MITDNSNKWSGNDTVFQKYFPGKYASKDDRHLKPTGSSKNDPGYSWDEVKNHQHIVGILQPEYIDISFDYDDSDPILSMIQNNRWNCVVLPNKKNHHIHTFWKRPSNWKSKGSMANVQLACGVLADIHYKFTAIPLRVNHEDRFPPIYDSPKDGEYQTVPVEFFPITAKGGQQEPGLFGMTEHDGRNDALSRWCMRIYKYLHMRPFQFGRDDIREICHSINGYIFKDPLEENELETILRDETFENIESQIDKAQKEVSALPKPMTAQELSVADIPAIEFVVKNLIPAGLSILASAPKIGKSWMCLDMALSVAAGKDFLGYQTEKCGVVYFALEDSFSRLQNRMNGILKGRNAPGGLLLYTAHDSEGNRVESIDNGFLEQLEEIVKEYPDTKLFIIDTYVKIQGVIKRNESGYQSDSRQVGALQSFAMSHGAAILIVTHTKKSSDDTDPVRNIMGTTGISGIADTMIVLDKEARSKNLTKMSITGRDIDTEEIPITFNKNTLKWERQGTSWDDTVGIIEADRKFEEYKSSNLCKVIHSLINDSNDNNNNKWVGTATEIIKKGEENGTPIEQSSRKLGHFLLENNGNLLMDGIVHIAHNNGSGAKKHEFYYTNSQKSKN